MAGGGGDFDLSLVVRADGSQAAAAGAELAGSVNAVANAERGAKGAAEGLAAGSRSLAAAQTEMMRSSSSATKAFQDNANAARANVSATKQATAAANDNIRAAKAQQFAIRNAGQQFGDFGLQIASGADPARAFSQQIGQLGYALGTLEKGPLKSVGAFLVGPWGIAFTVALAVLAPFVEKLFQTAQAAKDAELATSGLSDAESILADAIGKTSSKIAAQNSLLLINARLKAANLRIDAINDDKEAAKTFGQAGNAPGFAGAGQAVLLGQALGITPRGNQAVLDLAKRAEAARKLKDGPERTKAFDQIIKDAEGTSFKDSGTDFATLGGAISKAAASRANLAIADLIDKSLDDKKIAPELAKPGPKAKKPPKPKKIKADTLTGREDEDIQRINEQWDKTPTLIDKAAQSTRKLDDIIADLNKRKPPGFANLIADANRAKGTIQEGLIRPFTDYVEKQGEALAVQKLLVAGRVDEAEALRVVTDLEARMGPLNQQQKEDVLTIVQGMREQARALDDLRQRNAKYIEALGSIRGVVDDATQAFVRGDLGQLIKTPGKLLDAFQTLQGRKLFDKITGGVFDDLADQVNGVSPVKDASKKMAEAVDRVSASVRKSGSGVDKLGSAADRAAKAVENLATAANDNARAGGGFSPGVTSAKGQAVFDGLTKAFGSGQFSPGVRNAQGQSVFDGLTAGFGNGKDIVVSATKANAKSQPDLIAASIGGVATKIASIFTNPESAKNIGGAIGKGASGALNGAAQGSLIAGLGKAVGINLDKTGSQLGGALGGILTSIKPIANALGPIGQFVGPALSIIGGIVGNLFKPKSNAGAEISSANGQFSAGSASGASAALKSQASGLAGGVASALTQISQQLGGGVGNTAGISIGVNNGNFHVNAVGGTIGKKGSGDQNFGKDDAAAVSFAIQAEIAQGAITGLSAAVQKALKSSSNVDNALKEALGVKQLETALGGVTGAIRQIFETEKAAAAERLRLAKAYGLDVVATEALNEKNRLLLVESTIKERVGALSDFLRSVKFGDLFEGSAAERRDLLRAEIEKVRAKAEAGDAGAADQLAQLEQQLITTSRDAFGTAGDPYRTDRSEAIDAVQRVIDIETARINDATTAAQATTKAINDNNVLTGETNDILARVESGILDVGAILGRISGPDLNNIDLSSTVRSSKISGGY